MECRELAPAAGFSRVAMRNNSLSSTGRVFAFGFIFVVSVGIACAFAALGAWLSWAQRVVGRDGAVKRPRAARQ